MKELIRTSPELANLKTPTEINDFFAETFNEVNFNFVFPYMKCYVALFDHDSPEFGTTYASSK